MRSTSAVSRLPVQDGRQAADNDVADRPVLERSEDGCEQGHCVIGPRAGAVPSWRAMITVALCHDASATTSPNISIGLPSSSRPLLNQLQTTATARRSRLSVSGRPDQRAYFRYLTKNFVIATVEVIRFAVLRQP